MSGAPGGRTSVVEEPWCPGAGLGALFAPRGVAVIGASTSPGKLGAAMARSLTSFPGPVLLVNSRRPDPAAGLYPSVAEAVAATGAAVELAVLCVPAAVTAAALADAAAAGVKAALVCAGGFAEAGGAGVAHQAEVAAVAAATGVRLLGPNTSGFLAPGRHLVASFVPGAEGIPAGRVSVVAGSGGVLHAVAFLLAGAGLGLHLGVGIGNGLDVTAADVLDHLAAEAAEAAPHPLLEGVAHRDGAPRPPKARGGRLGPVALHVEGVTDGRRLVEAVERCSELVPVVALVVGRTDVGELARSHTGALTPAWRTARAALRAAGAVLVDDERDLVDALVALDTARLPPAPDPGVGLVTGQAGPAVLFTDRLKTAGVAVPPLSPSTAARLAELLPALTHQGNPVDTGRPGETFADVLTAVGADPAVDLLAVYALLEPGAFDLAAAVHSAAATRLGPPVVVATGGPAGDVAAATGGPAGDVAAARRELAAAGIAAYDGVAGAVAGVRALVEDARAGAARAAAGPPVRIVVAEPFTVPVGEHEGKRLLASLGIATPAREACDDRADAHAALARLGPPVVAKMLDPVVLHKAAVGGVRLGVRTAADLDAALDALDAAGARRYLVEETAPPGLDLIVGARRDPVFGPMVVLGLGGDLAEDLGTVTVRPAPLAEAAAGAMLDELLGGPTAAGPDRAAVVAAVTSLGALLAAVPDLYEIEINPLRALGNGRPVALDVVVTASATGTVEPVVAAVADGQGGL
ncbi:MAG TPA: acetate--CoA ligase family protein [Acidimicrobiia bacterium]|nr:acetate--CoA ligase family protein [Acidimicrobiia bacterium]